MTSKTCAPGAYPSYMDLDRFLDIPRLRGLDQYVADRLRRRVDTCANDLQFFTGPFVLDEAAPKLPGSQMVYLSRSSREDNYYDLNEPDAWHPSHEASEFPELMDFIATLPFAKTARMLIMYDPQGRNVTAHRDHDSEDLCHEFFWFRTNLAKPFYMLNPQTGEKLYVDSHAAWFDTVNQFHGADAVAGLSFSIRVDGVFTEAFRDLIPRPNANLASAPSLWALQGDRPRVEPAER